MMPVHYIKKKIKISTADISLRKKFTHIFARNSQEFFTKKSHTFHKCIHAIFA